MKKILIIEDNEDNMALAIFLLTKAGWYEVLENHNYDVIRVIIQ